VALQVATSTSNILVHLRYCGWIEAELTPTRVFAEPKEILATFVETQEKLAEEFRVKQEAEKTPPGDTSVGENPVPVPPVVQEPVVFTADEQDSRVNAPFPLTKQ
jgi:hypothetical protein